MFHDSRQRRQWMFSCKNDIDSRRNSIRESYRSNHPDRPQLTTTEEERVLQYYLQVVVNLCSKFEPCPPPSTFATCTAYFCRFFLSASLEQYHPKDIAVLSVYMGFKVDEYNVSIDEFCSVVAPNSSCNLADFIINHELLVLQTIKYCLLVHGPFRPFEGLLLEMRTRRPELNADSCRESAERFLYKSLLTHVGLLYAPSKIALAALTHVLGPAPLEHVLETSAAGQDGVRSKLTEDVAAIEDLVSKHPVIRKQDIKHLLAALPMSQMPPDIEDG